MYFFAVLLTAILLLTPLSVSAQVVINEISPSSDSEWIELYKIGSDLISLEGCVLYLDDNTKIQKIIFAANDTFANTLLVISEGDNAYNWNSNWMHNGGDKISLVCPNFTDSLSYGVQAGAQVAAPESGKTVGRNPDGTGNFTLLADPTKGDGNSEPPTPTPTPTEKLAPTSKPTATPKPTATAKPNAISKPTLTGVPITPLQKFINEIPAVQREIQVLSASDAALGTGSSKIIKMGIQDNNKKGSEVVQEVQIEGDKTDRKLLPLFVTFGGGIVIIGLGLFTLLRRLKKGYTFGYGEKGEGN